MLFAWLFGYGLLIGLVGAALFTSGMYLNNNDLLISSFALIGLSISISIVVITINCYNKPVRKPDEPVINPANSMKRNKSDTDLELITGKSKQVVDLNQMYDDV